MTVHVSVETELGPFTLALDEDRAPISVTNFLRYVDGGHLDGARAYRIVTMANQPPDTPHKIEVVQWGYRASDERPAPFPPIPHEPTSVTGLRHRHMTLSMARFAPGSAGSEFFICIGDQPELDEGGRRNPDLAGFAAFGAVSEGEDTVMRIFGRSEPQEMIAAPVRFTRVRRLDR